MQMTTRMTYIIATAIAILIAGGAYGYKILSVPPPPPREVPALGELGSEHAHIALLVMIGKESVNFCKPAYMLKSRVAHFEDDECFIVHKHATGVTLPTFFRTLGVNMTASCIETPDDGKFCNDDNNTLRAVINGLPVAVSELSFYELKNNDHILVNYGPEDGATLKYKYNQIPNIPQDVNLPRIK